jgi:hypothetical protein
MKRASTILQDDGAVRWTALELRDYLNDALREVVTLKPNAKTVTAALPLVEGAHQDLPAQYTMLCRVICNKIAGNSRAIRPLAKRELMDAQIPNWQDTTGLAFSASVTHVIHDLADPRSYYVVPGNTGTGMIECVLGAIPTAVPLPVADQLLIESYVANVDIPDIYQNALTDYVLYRAFSKDAAVPGAAQRSVAHLELFRGAIQGFGAAEAAMSVAASAMRPQG